MQTCDLFFFFFFRVTDFVRSYCCRSYLDVEGLTVKWFQMLITTNNGIYAWGRLPLLLLSKVQLFGEHGGEAGHLFLPNGVAVEGETDAPHRHFPVNQRQQLCEFQRVSIFVEEVTQILDVPGAVHRLPVGVVTLATEHGSYWLNRINDNSSSDVSDSSYGCIFITSDVPSSSALLSEATSQPPCYNSRACSPSATE